MKCAKNDIFKIPIPFLYLESFECYHENVCLIITIQFLIAGLKSPCIMCIQYIGGCSVHWGVFSTWGDTMSTSGGYHEYIGGIS